MITVLVKIIRFMFISVLTATTLITPVNGDKEGRIKPEKEDCRASFGVISDLHLRDNFIFEGLAELGYDDMENAAQKLDALVFCGDITDHGYTDMWERFAKVTAKYDLADQLIIVEGNHDTWGPDRENLDTVKQTFIDYNKKIANRDISEMYYTADINGYPVIVLGSEGDNTNATISDTQVQWFAEQMEEASKTGKPIFVFCHQPFNKTHGLPRTWEMETHPDWDDGGIGEKSDEIRNIVKKYDNVFFISGHIHAGFSTGENNLYSSVECYDGYTLINVPSFAVPDVQRKSNPTNGTGYIIEVYDDEVLIRARNFITGTWCTKYDVTVAISK